MFDKVPIQRIRRESAGIPRPLRTARACVSCQQRKRKCDGGKPLCSQCRAESLTSCVYSEGKLKMEREELAFTRRKVEIYEDLLRDLFDKVEDKDAQRITKALTVSSPIVRHSRAESHLYFIRIQRLAFADVSPVNRELPPRLLSPRLGLLMPSIRSTKTSTAMSIAEPRGTWGKIPK